MKTPKVFHPSAQGCRVGEATLGHGTKNDFNPNGVASTGAPRLAATPSGLTGILIRLPRVARASQPWAARRYPVAVNSPRPRPVERILAAQPANPAADTSAWEREIDQHVHALYALTPEEIQLVEAASK